MVARPCEFESHPAHILTSEEDSTEFSSVFFLYSIWGIIPTIQGNSLGTRRCAIPMLMPVSREGVLVISDYTLQ